MSEQVAVPYGDSASDTAVLLLAAAETLDLDPSVVVSQEGHFLAPKEVADEAGVDYDGDEDAAPAAEPQDDQESDKPAKKTAAKKSSSSR